MQANHTLHVSTNSYIQDAHAIWYQGVLLYAPSMSGWVIVSYSLAKAYFWKYFNLDVGTNASI